MIGAFARIIQGADEVTHGVDVVPSLRGGNLQRLGRALRDLGEHISLDEAAIRDGTPLRLRTAAGELKIVVEPAGTRGGYEDLRRAAAREPIGKGLRPPVASTADLARMLAALGREAEKPKLRALRRLSSLERSLAPDLSL